MAPTLSDQLAGRVRTTLRRADHPSSGAGSAAEWRARRDRWIDALDPREVPQFSEEEIRSLIDFLAESGPSSPSRMTPREWHNAIDALTPELLFATQSQ
ncbi:hypothetical protein [Glaciihabitans sp. dw_435]|uniref:hypothetical protein n=1 Tax=Glaciihabitans sp. dw_435 TaxID=2720081 RepID=UPI001BD46803|nr:hypothetical protein [Glaciihabitans sp. dw_435]